MKRLPWHSFSAAGSFLVHLACVCVLDADASLLKLSKVHHTALRARLLGRKYKQMRIQNIVNSDVENTLTAFRDGADKGTSETCVATTMVAAIQLGCVVLACP